MEDSSISDCKPCEKCGARSEAVRNAQDGMKMVGFYCPACQHWDKAVGRERKL